MDKYQAANLLIAAGVAAGRIYRTKQDKLKDIVKIANDIAEACGDKKT